MNIEENGFEVHPRFLDAKLVNEIVEDIECPEVNYPKQGIRHAEKKFASVKTLVDSRLLSDRAQCYLEGIPN